MQNAFMNLTYTSERVLLCRFETASALMRLSEDEERILGSRCKKPCRNKSTDDACGTEAGIVAFCRVLKEPNMNRNGYLWPAAAQPPQGPSNGGAWEQQARV